MTWLIFTSVGENSGGMTSRMEVKNVEAVPSTGLHVDREKVS